MSSDDFNGHECVIAMFPKDKQAERRGAGGGGKQQY